MTLQFDPKEELITGSEMSFLHSLRELVEKISLTAAKEGGELGGGGRDRGVRKREIRKIGKVWVFLITAQLSLLVMNLVIKVNSVRHAWKCYKSPNWL